MDSEKIQELQSIINQKNEEIARLNHALEEEQLKFKNELQAAHDYYEKDRKSTRLNSSH